MKYIGNFKLKYAFHSPLTTFILNGLIYLFICEIKLFVKNSRWGIAFATILRTKLLEQHLKLAELRKLSP